METWITDCYDYWEHLAREEYLKQQMQKVESNPESNPIPVKA